MPVPVVQPLPAPVVTWGRWAAFAGEAPFPDTAAFRATYGPRVTSNSAYILSVANGANVRMPEAGQFDFKLTQAEAFETQTGQITGRATVSGGQLSINFGARTFNTSLSVLLPDVSLSLTSRGRVLQGGYLEGDFVYSTLATNMTVRGQLAGSLSNQAAYLFEAPVNGTGRGVVGATFWGR